MKKMLIFEPFHVDRYKVSILYKSYNKCMYKECPMYIWFMLIDTKFQYQVSIYNHTHK